MSAGYFPKRNKLGLRDLFKGLVNASHILHYHDVLDAYGHVSVRSPDNAATFWMPCNMPPALVSSMDDLVEYYVESAEAVEKNAKPGYIERSIHSEIYKRFPNINSVVHSHADDVLPYCVSGVPLKNTIHTAGFLGTSVPVWNSSGSDFLVRDSVLGASLAASFKPATSAAFIYSKVRSALPGAKPEPSLEPDHAVVLLQSHGFTTVAQGIEEAVYQAIYTKEAAKVQTNALTIHNAFFSHTLEGQVDIEGGGKIKSAKTRGEGDLKYLNEKQAHDSWESLRTTVSRPWALWCREVEINPLYRNDFLSDED